MHAWTRNTQMHAFIFSYSSFVRFRPSAPECLALYEGDNDNNDGMFQRDELSEKQQEHFMALHKQAKQQEEKLKEKEVACREEVERAVQHNLELTHIQEQELAGMNTLGLIYVAGYEQIYL